VHDALVRRDIQRIAVDRDAEREAEVLTCITDTRRPQLLYLERRLDVDELGRRIDVLVLVAARGEEKRREAEERESAHH
jgi:hypothetical protein